MTNTIAILVLTSAMLHPLWNLLLKRHSDTELAYVGLTTTMSLSGLSHALYLGSDLLAVTQVLPLLAISLCGQILYGTCLTATLQRGELSTYYPIIRSSPVFIVIVGLLFLGRSYSALTLLGITMAVAGGFILLYRRGTNMLSDHTTLALSLIAMSGTGIYSFADSQIMQAIPPQVQMFWLEGTLTPIFIAKYLFNRRKRNPAQTTPSRNIAAIMKRASYLILPGLLSYTSYYLILHAYSLGGEVAAVTAVRQASIPISVLLGGYYLREGAIARRLIASVILATGIAIIVTGD